MIMKTSRLSPTLIDHRTRMHRSTQPVPNRKPNET